jgi:hypothetical protein
VEDFGKELRKRLRKLAGVGKGKGKDGEIEDLAAWIEERTVEVMSEEEVKEIAEGGSAILG